MNAASAALFCAGLALASSGCSSRALGRPAVVAPLSADGLEIRCPEGYQPFTGARGPACCRDGVLCD